MYLLGLKKNLFFENKQRTKNKKTSDRNDVFK